MPIFSVKPFAESTAKGKERSRQRKHQVPDGMKEPQINCSSFMWELKLAYLLIVGGSFMTNQANFLGHYFVRRHF